MKCVETLAAQDRCYCWNVPDMEGNSPIMIALQRDRIKIVEILLRSSRVDLNCRDSEGWSLLFRALQKKKLGEEIWIYIKYFHNYTNVAF